MPQNKHTVPSNWKSLQEQPVVDADFLLERPDVIEVRPRVVLPAQEKDDTDGTQASTE